MNEFKKELIVELLQENDVFSLLCGLQDINNATTDDLLNCLGMLIYFKKHPQLALDLLNNSLDINNLDENKVRSFEISFSKIRQYIKNNP